MRRLVRAVAVFSTWLSASVGASAADLETLVRVPAGSMIPHFTWTGSYVGFNAGGGLIHHSWSDSLFGLNFSANNDGVVIAGGQVGGNYQINNFVVGVEGAFDLAPSNNNTAAGIVVPALGGNLIQASSNDRWISTLAARVGVAFDRVLLYAKGGGGWAGNNGITVTNLTTGALVTGSSNTAGGWLVGAGLEWAFANDWSVKVEYDYVGLNARTFTVPSGAPFLIGDTFTDGGNNVQMLTVGINFLMVGIR